MVGRNIIDILKNKNHNLHFPSSKELNLNDNLALRKFLNEIKPDIVIHAAGKVGGIHANIKEPYEFLLENLNIGTNIVSESYKAGIKNLINIGSSCMYPRNIEIPIKEEKILQGELEPTNEGYALAKISTYKLCEYISKSNKNYQYKTLVPCNIYGLYDSFTENKSHLIPAIINKLHYAKINSQDEVEIWGDGEARREFMFASDLANAIYKAIDDINVLPKIMNIGAGTDYSINDYYQIIAEVINYKGKFIHNLDKPVGMKRKIVNIDLQTKWGWQASVSLKEGVEITYKHYLNKI